MRDLLVTLVVFGALPLALARPYIGVLLYSWISYMNPHRLTWGFAFNFPFAEVAALATLVALLFSREPKRLPWSATVAVWVLLIAWVNLTTVYALNPHDAFPLWDKFMKIQLMTLVTMLVMGTRQRINALLWVVALSIAFYGVKGGLFTLLTGGHYRVWGPPGGFFEDNNSLGLALIMTMPILWYLQTTVGKWYAKWGLRVAIVLVAVAVIGTYSRGALLGITAMGLFLWLKSRQKAVLLVLIVAAAPAIYTMMPHQWHSRMGTIETYQQDRSAMGRIHAWRFSFQIANQRVTGTGFGGLANGKYYQRYAPALYQEIMGIDKKFRAAHSIYFGILGEHGWIGLVLFVLLGLLAFRNGTWVIKQTRRQPEQRWARDLAAMLQVSLIGYAVAGAFLSLQYFDFTYLIAAVLVLLKAVVREDMQRAQEPASSHSSEFAGMADKSVVFDEASPSARGEGL